LEALSNRPFSFFLKRKSAGCPKRKKELAQRKETAMRIPKERKGIVQKNQKKRKIKLHEVRK